MMLAFACAVSWIIDGDTFICRDGRHIRLAGIDAPKLAGHCAAGRHCAPGNAKASLHSLIALAKGREASCEPLGRSYDRVLAFCSVGGADLSCAQLRAGQAIRRYSFGPQVCRR
jgi:micrococcal nuclease